ncbi:hypothetical protein ANAEL_00640 [Anaerolineales bacterium]|nr:hypothetical protein ANAEL_00640 [Anaerolineales bacterium]
MSITIFLVFLAVTILWFFLPLIPALREFIAPTDIAPLTVVSRESSDIAFFANNFRNYLLPQIEKFNFTLLQNSEPAMLPDGTPFVRVQGAEQLPFQQHQSMNMVDYLVIAGDETMLPNSMTLLREVYGVGSLRGGDDCVYRAILVEGDLELRRRCVILRWVHSVGGLDAQEGTILHGRASSDQALHLAPGVTFEWIAAPVISVVSAKEYATETSVEKVQRSPIDLGDMVAMSDNTYRTDGDFAVPEKSLVTGHLVVTGGLVIGPGAHIRGNLKAHETVTLGDGCRIDGSIVARSTVFIGKNCIIGGPLISEKEITVGHGSAIGTQEKPATVSAPRVSLHSGVTVSGMVVANNEGKTVS